ncbi:hypothetical protein [Nostoc linckia]|nr:hypothetical protein [Nostoc linckia]
MPFKIARKQQAQQIDTAAHIRGLNIAVGLISQLQTSASCFLTR